MVSLLFVQAGIALLLGSVIYRQCFAKKAGPRLPPGPKPLPIVGNIMDLPPKGVPEFQHWLKHKETHGLISSITVMGQILVIIHDRQAAHDLMEKKAIKTSARPRSEFASGLCGLGEFVTMQQYDDKFRLYRKLIHQELGTKAAASRFNDLQEVEVRRLLLRILDKPEDLIQHIKT